MVFEDVVEKAVAEKDRFIMQIYKEYCLSKGLNFARLMKKRRKIFRRDVYLENNIETHFHKKTPIFKLQSQVQSGNDNSFNIVYNYEKLF